MWKFVVTKILEYSPLQKIANNIFLSLYLGMLSRVKKILSYPNPNQTCPEKTIK